MARPTDYTKELADEICADLAMGMSLRTVCSKESRPCVATIYNWFRTYPQFLEQYARAKEEAADAMVEDMLDIADDEAQDVQRSRLRIDTRKWIASKLKAKKYGERIEAPIEPVKHVFLFEDADDTAQG